MAKRATVQRRPRSDPSALFALLDGYHFPHELLEADLVALGKKAVPVLTRQVSDEQRGWRAARLLGRIGAPAASSAVPTLIDAMKKAKSEPGRAWPARALAQLGRFDALEPLLASSKKTDHFTLAEGLKAGRPRAYEHLEHALSTGPATLRRFVTETLSPGSARFEFAASELPLVTAALRSRHAVLRRDAVCNLTHVEKRARGQLAPLLLAALGDPDANVRRLAVWAFDALGVRALRAAAPALAPLKEDRAEAVRQTAAQVLARVGA